MESRYFYTITGSELTGTNRRDEKHGKYNFHANWVLAQTEGMQITLLIPFTFKELEGEDKFKLPNIDFLDTDTNQITYASINEYNLLFGYILAEHQPLFEIVDLLEYQFLNTNNKQGFLYTLKHQIIEFRNIERAHSRISIPDIDNLIRSSRIKIIKEWMATKEKETKQLENKLLPIQDEIMTANEKVQVENNRTKLLLLHQLGVIKLLRENNPKLTERDLSRLVATILHTDSNTDFNKIAESLRSDIRYLDHPKDLKYPYTAGAIKKVNEILTKFGLPIFKKE